jgi:hypothetical protein
LTEFEQLGRLQMFWRYAIHEHQPKAPRHRVEAVIGADNRTEGRFDVLEGHAAEFARLAGADKVRGDLKQHGLPLGLMAQHVLCAPALADIEGHYGARVVV